METRLTNQRLRADRLPSSGDQKIRLRSAFEVAHRREPQTPYLTALYRGPELRYWVRHAELCASGLIRRRNVRWRGDVGYIMVGEDVEVAVCEVIFDKPFPRDPRVFASNHLGRMAHLEPAGGVA